MNVFELLLLLVVADLVQSSIMQNDLSLTGGILAVSTFGLLTALMSALTTGRQSSSRRNVPVPARPVGR
jgi:uncharacterized membrane protein YcaP (DUF421 family)